MLLIIFLGLIAKFTLVCGECDVGSSEVDDFNFIRATGKWYVYFHDPNAVEDQLDCVVFNIGLPQGNVSLITVEAYNITEQRHVSVNGIAINWNNTGLEEIYPPPSMWNGRYYIIAEDYDRFCIHKYCSVETNEMHVQVSFRKKHPKPKTILEVLEKLKKHNIDINQLEEYSGDHCQQSESSEEDDSF